MNNIIQELQKWFQKQCNGNWEHGKGITIMTCDNPAWWVKIDLKETSFENKPFQTIIKNVEQVDIDLSLGVITLEEYFERCAKLNNDEQIKRSLKDFSEDPENSEVDDWLMCHIRDKEFNGAGDYSKLEQILKIFLDWTKS